MLGHIFLNEVVDRKFLVLRFLQNIGRLAESFRHNRVQRGIRTCDGIRRPHHAEFKFIARERKRRSSVPVCGILLEIGQRAHTCEKFASLLHRSRLACLDQLRHHVLKLLAQKNGNDSRRRFVRSKSVIVSYIGSRLTQQVCMGVHGLHNAGKNQEKLHVFVRRIAGIQKVHPVVRGDRPVIVFTGAVHSRIRLLMQKTTHVMFDRHPLHRLHGDLIVIHRNIGRLVDGRQFMLRGSHLVVLCLCRYAKLPQLRV